MSVNNRCFKIKNNEKLYGKYLGNTPYQAANKALSEIIRSKEKNNDKNDLNKIIFTLIETTKGSKHKEHNYIGNRTLLKEPIVYKTNNEKIITKKYKNNLKKIKNN